MTNTNYEKKYKKIKSVKDFIAEKFSGILIAGVFAFLTSKIPVLWSTGSLTEMLISTSKDSAIFLAIIIYPVLKIITIVEKRYKEKVIDNGPMPTFNHIIKTHTDEVLNHIENCYSWGENLSDCWCPILLDGWRTSDVIISKMDLNKYDVAPTDEKQNFVKEIFANYDNYLKQDDVKNVLKLDDNMKRLMLTSYRTNYNTSNSKLVINLQKTDFITNKYLWNYYQNSNENVKKELVSKAINSKEVLPNSFCLHLVIETNDDKILCSISSKQKSNDTPYSLATTLGEQIELTDILSENGDDYNFDFVEKWIRRALVEEFGLNEIFLNEIYNKDSSRVLSIDFEGDRYNFSLLAITRIKYNFNQFIDLVKKTYKKNEFDMIGYIDVDEISEVLLNYNVKLKNSSYVPKYLNKEYKLEKVKYHESTYLRLLMILLQKRGVRKTIEELEKGEKC